jgi:hypothetical protein
MGRSPVGTVGLVALSLVALAACGESNAGASLSDPVQVTEGYMNAVAGGNKDGGLTYLETDINDGIALTDSTSASRFMAAHKGAKWMIVQVNYPDPGTTNPKPTKKACTVIPPQGGDICIVTVQVDADGKPTWFHFTVENRYHPGSWRIVDVDQVDQKPDNLLPAGNEAHSA